MAYTILVNSTPADSIDVNDNFYHIAQGTIFPMTGSSLDITNAAANLGSPSYRWNNVYCTTLNGLTDNRLWHAMAEIEVNSATSSIEFTGLNGDSEYQYKILYSIGKNAEAGTASSFKYYFNNDSTGSNYSSRANGDAGSAAHSLTTGYDAINSLNTASGGTISESNVGVIVLNARSGNEKFGWYTQAFVAISTASSSFVSYHGIIFHNNTATLTSIKFEFFDTYTGKFSLLRRGYV